MYREAKEETAKVNECELCFKTLKLRAIAVIHKTYALYLMFLLFDKGHRWKGESYSFYDPNSV